MVSLAYVVMRSAVNRVNRVRLPASPQLYPGQWSWTRGYEPCSESSILSRGAIGRVADWQCARLSSESMRVRFPSRSPILKLYANWTKQSGFHPDLCGFEPRQLLQISEENKYSRRFHKPSPVGAIPALATNSPWQAQDLPVPLVKSRRVPNSSLLV